MDAPGLPNSLYLPTGQNTCNVLKLFLMVLNNLQQADNRAEAPRIPVIDILPIETS